MERALDWSIFSDMFMKTGWALATIYDIDTLHLTMIYFLSLIGEYRFTFFGGGSDMF
jgi:hypothetical protein